MASARSAYCRACAPSSASRAAIWETRSVGGESIVAVRSMAPWALDYHADGRGLGFPFDLASLDLSARCLHLLAALRTFLRTPPADAQVLKALETLERMLRPLEKDQPP